MRIAIVDDIPGDLNLLNKDVCRWADESGIPLVPAPALFERGEALLDRFQPGMYDVIFLDIYMNGMDTARQIRLADTSCRLIFITSTPDFAVDSYTVNSTYYLVKPYDYDRLKDALARCSAEFLEQQQSILVSGQNGQEKLFLHQVAYTEYANRKICVHFTDGSQSLLSMNQADMASALLPYPYFCCCIRGILVNLEAVDQMTADSFLMKGGGSVPISRLKYREVREQFLDFCFASTRRTH